ncbi:benzoate 1,2-dioxygenase large subunit [Pigmentiphaga soli]|uniref:Benzoate 1,2-dioxygenase large subunit n=1 Tax=Pigmentiphaga soli TaxID=1007095 RepID=A0ABP8HRS5_9BURK
MVSAELLDKLKRCVDDRPEAGVFRVHRDVYTDPEIFELEQRFIFERSWSFLCLESQLPKAFDFVTAHIGRVPVVVTRGEDMRLRAFLNACRHKGAQLLLQEQGSRRSIACPYHGWSYDTQGRNIAIKARDTGHYGPAFDAAGHDLLPLARLASYKGLVFGCLDPGVPALEDFLGDMKFFIDLYMDQGPDGMEAVPGRAVYTYRGNWKLQMDNGMDYYHLTSTHSSFLDVQAKRRRGEGNQAARQFDWAKRESQQGGTFLFRHGHALNWLRQPEAEKRPIWPVIDEIRARVGEQRAQWMLNLKNCVVFPNMQIADATSLLLRTFRPISAGETEMRVYCLAPRGESPERRAWRLRQFEDFFNPSGFATPDDTVVYEDCQSGYHAGGSGGPGLFDYTQGCERGRAILQTEPGGVARELGIAPAGAVEGGFEVQQEMCFMAPYREWQRLMLAGAAGAPAYGDEAGAAAPPAASPAMSSPAMDAAR